MISRRSLVAGTALAAASLPSATLGQTTPFPSRPISIHVGFATSSVDQLVRIVANSLSKEFGQPVIVLNQPGVSGTMAPSAMARSAAPDGHTIAFLPSSLMRLPHLQKVSYDVLNDFTFIVGLWSTTTGVSVRADAPWKSLPELLAYATAHPDRISFGGVGSGTPGYFALQRMARQAGFKATYVPYRGGPDLYGAMLGGHLDVVIEGGFGPYVDGGKVRALAVLEAQRVRYWPELATAREQGFDVVIDALSGFGGPKGMDPAVVKVLSEAVRRACESTEFQRLLQSYGYPLRNLSPDAYRAYAASLYASEQRLIQESGYKPE